MPALIPPLRAGLNVAADVLLYVLHPDFTLSLQKASRQRLVGLLDTMSATGQQPGIILVAHGQGTVVARDVLRNGRHGVIQLITAGSPLASLYERFLGIRVSKIDDIHWTNVYRRSDYVGGPLLQSGITDSEIDGDYRNAHFLYFQNRYMMRKIS